MFRIHGPTLHRLRVLRGLNQAELAETTGIDATVLSRLERGQRHGTPAQIKRLADFFTVDIDELCNVTEVA